MECWTSCSRLAMKDAPEPHTHMRKKRAQMQCLGDDIWGVWVTNLRHTLAPVEIRETRTTHEKRLENTPQGLQSSPRRLAVSQRVHNVWQS